MDFTHQTPAALQALLAAIVSSSDDAIVSKNLHGVVQSWNAGASRIFGYSEAEMIGKSITVLFPSDRLDEEPRILEQIRQGNRVEHFETIRMHKDGRAIDVSVTISPVKDATGEVVGVSKVARDITPVKRYLAEREALLKRETIARAEAERIGRLKDEFLSTLSHELRTPLNAILGWATLMKRSVDRGSSIDLADGLATIERNARAQAQLIDELLDMSRVVNGKLQLELQSFDLPTLISNAIDSLRPAADARRIQITHALDPKAGSIVADPNRIQQVMWNLLSNAIKFTPPGERVQVLLRKVDSEVEITVADSGKGIAADFMPFLFNRFMQEESGTMRQNGGLGLGLAIVKSIVELHGGQICANSPGVDLGSTFVVTLPVVAAHRSCEITPRETSTQDAPSLETSDFSGYHVLVVDDEADGRSLIRQILGECNATLSFADSATDALNQFRSGRPNLIVSDIGMPGRDGYDLIRSIRALSREEGGDTPAIALTAFARSEDRCRALLAGFQMHLPKPVDQAELIAVISSFHAASRPYAVESRDPRAHAVDINAAQ